MSTKKGGFLPGLLLGFLLGVATSLGVALYVTKAPVPFIDKVPQGSTRSGAADPGSKRDPATILADKPASEAGASYFVQTGAFARIEDAEQQRARLAMMGLTARITEREQTGRTVYRVRLGPFEAREDAESTRSRVAESGLEAALVRVQR